MEWTLGATELLVLVAYRTPPPLPHTICAPFRITGLIAH